MTYEKTKKIQEIQNTYVLSTGRTGTTHLAAYLQKNVPELLCVQEPFPGWFFQLMSNRAAISPLQWPWSTLTESLLKKSYKRTLLNSGAKHRVEINPFLYGLIPMLQSFFGPCTIIHMVRHPYGFVRSMLNFKPGRFKNMFFHGSLWNPNIKKVYGFSKDDWIKLSFFERKAYLWCFINQTILEQKPKNSNYHLLRFEDWLSPTPEIRTQTRIDLFSHLGITKKIPSLEIDKTLRTNASLERNPNPKEIPQAAFNNISKICGPQMKCWGYLPDGTTSPLRMPASL